MTDAIIVGRPVRVV